MVSQTAHFFSKFCSTLGITLSCLLLFTLFPSHLTTRIDHFPVVLSPFIQSPLSPCCQSPYPKLVGQPSYTQSSRCLITVLTFFCSSQCPSEHLKHRMCSVCFYEMNEYLKRNRPKTRLTSLVHLI